MCVLKSSHLETLELYLLLTILGYLLICSKKAMKFEFYITELLHSLFSL